MHIKQLQLSVVALLFLFSFEGNSQKLWKQLSRESTTVQKKEVRIFKNFPSTYFVYQLDVDKLSAQLNTRARSSETTVFLPNGRGNLELFKVTASSNLNTELAAKYPSIQSYTAVGLENSASMAKISLGSDGFHAVIFSSEGKTIYIDPYSKDNKEYIVYKTSSLKEEAVAFKCNVEETAKNSSFTSFSSKVVNDGNLRTFRLALVCSGEYAQFHLNNQNVSSAASNAVKKTAVLSAMNTSMTRVNGIFERELAIKMMLVNNNDDLIFLDANTDNITDGDPDEMISEVQIIADNLIGTANYDIGHVFSIGGDGLAGLGVVCVTGQKARGVTGRSSPIGDPYDIDFVAHEMGHQFGGTHTQNNDCNRTASTAVEPGSASTIMGYAGICSPNVQGVSDAYFHAVSINQMQAIIASSGSCATLTNNGNTAPIADAGLNYSIPKATPFILKGVATDADGIASLTYNWEQTDAEVATMPPLASNTEGPMFRSLPATLSPDRYMPALATVIAGNTSSTWEVVPNNARDLNFSLLVRDNNSTGGATSRDNMVVSVTEANAFTVTSQSSAITWDAGSTQTITWDKGSTDTAPINCQKVTIRLSEDGGKTFPLVLAENTDNDGAENIIIPNNITTQARIMVAAADNIFYNVNAVNFEIQSTTPSFIVKNTSGELSACNSGNQTASFTLNLDFINGFSEEVSFTTTGEPAGSSIVFSPTVINNDGDVVITVSNLNGVVAQEYTINVQGNSTSINQNIDIKLSVTDANLETVTLTTPMNGEAEVSLVETLRWQEDTNASSYLVDVASDVNFERIVASGTPSANMYVLNNLNGNTIYYWRVKAKNNCNEGAFSSVFSFTTETPKYCSSTFTDEAGGSEHITNVTFNSINNNSGNDLIDGYEDFTAISTAVLKDVNYTVSVTFDTGGFQDHCYVFIDWNQDYIFDKETERYDLGTKLDDISIATFSIKVPTNARFGETTMRVLIEYDDPDDGFGDGSCDADHKTEWGETEDYTIVVSEPILDPKNVSVQTVSETCIAENDGIINVNVKQDSFNYNVSVRNATTTLNSTITGLIESFTGLAPGVYQVCVETVQLNTTQCFEVEILASQPIALRTTVNRSARKYTFNIDAGTAPYSVFLNDRLLETFNEKNFEIALTEGGTLEVKTAKDCEGAYKTTIDTVLLLQNPIVNTIELLLPLGIEKANLETLIFDINGKLIFKRLINVQDNRMSIPFRNFAKGIYILKLPINSKPIKILK